MTIDGNSWLQAQRAVARIVAGPWSGTGYLVAANLVVTSHGIVSHAGTSKVDCTFGEGVKRTGELAIARCNVAADIAVLELSLPVDVSPLDVIGAPESENLCVVGYPVAQAGSSSRIAAVLIAGVSGSELELSCKQVEAVSPERLVGLAGSPVFDGRKVVGHVSRIERGYARAVPGERIRAALDLPVQAVHVRVAAPSQVEIAGLAEIEAAMTEGEVDAALSRAPGGKRGALAMKAGARLLELALAAAAARTLDPLDPTPERDAYLAVASSLLGDHVRAQGLLASAKDGHALAVRGGVHKRRWLETSNKRWLGAALDAYTAGYKLDGDHYAGVNAAFCLLAERRVDESRKLATELASRLQELTVRDAWMQASLAEALLLSDRIPESRVAYTEAARRHRTMPRNLAIMRRQARLVLGMIGEKATAFDDLFGVPRAAAFSGHRTDPDEKAECFPPSREGVVARAIKDALDRADVMLGYSSAASGGDILFIEALLGRGGQANIVLPFPDAEFAEESVAPDWRPRYKKVLAHSNARVTVQSDRMPTSADEQDAAYVACNEAIAAAARAQAKALDEQPLMIAVVADEASAPSGGTMDAVRRWRNRGDPVVTIDPSSPAPTAREIAPVMQSNVLDVYQQESAYQVALTLPNNGPIIQRQRHAVTLPEHLEQALAQSTLRLDAKGLDALAAALRAKFLPNGFSRQLVGALGLHVRVQHDQASAHIPFELLLSATPPTGIDHTFALNGGVSRALVTDGEVTPPRIARGARVLLVADPKSNLPKSSAEAAALHRELAPDSDQVTVLEGSDATIERVGTLLPRFDIVHYAGHATADGLQLADGMFTADRLQKDSDGPSLVVLNACESAVVDGVGNETLARAFLGSGVRTFVGTGWRIPDSAAARFGRRFLLEVLGGTPVGGALATVLRDLKEREFDDTWFYYRLFGNASLRFPRAANWSTTPPGAAP